MQTRPKSLLLEYDAYESVDSNYDYRWKLRLLQSIWRCKNNLPAKKDGKNTRGAALPWPDAKRNQANFFTPKIGRVVEEFLNRPNSENGLNDVERIYSNLLSSQLLCFNLFGELLEDDFSLASTVLSDMTQGQIKQVTNIEFEWSPGRDDDLYTGDKSAFDVYIKYLNANDMKGFLGIEVKYHEDLKKSKSDEHSYERHGERYEEIAERMNCFDKHTLENLRPPSRLNQMWRNHLLVGSHADVDDFNEGIFVFLFPEVNTACSEAVEAYQECLADQSTFKAWTLDTLVSCLMSHTDAAWVQQFFTRYLDLSQLPLPE